MFAVNDKVVCVDDSNQHHPEITVMDHVMKGQVYVVRYARTSDGAVYLVGMCAGHWTVDGSERPYAARRFRKVSEVGTPKRMSRKRFSKLQAKCRAFIRYLQEEHAKKGGQL